MVHKLSEINRQALENPAQFIRQSDEEFEQQLDRVAQRIIAHTAVSPIVFMAGPSGSGKTTTAQKISAHVIAGGAKAHTVALDHYFRSVSEKTYPRTEDGELDYESPYCLDLDLLQEHFHALNRGERIEIPRYHFTNQTQQKNTGEFLQVEPGDMVIFEGIHALNDMFAEMAPQALRLYISPSSSFVDDGGQTVLSGTALRLCRRILRDNQFRNTPAKETMRMWANIRRGELKNIDPYKDRADLQIDSALAYEACIMRGYMQELMADIPEHIGLHEEIAPIPAALSHFTPIAPELVAPEGLLREFMGGGIYEY